jgi:flagellar motility protein MotE (MotC chaperone)
MKLRVLPIAITGVALLLALKMSGLLLTGHYSFSTYEEKARQMAAVQANYRPSAAAHASNSWNEYDPVITGSVPAKKGNESAKPDEAKAADGEKPTEGEAQPADAEGKPDVPPIDAAEHDKLKDIQNKNPEDLSSAEKALLDRLQSRREELEAREKELDLRENLLRAAEKKVEDRISELKGVEDRIAAFESARKAEEDQKLKDLVTMYENMKPKQAAAIFDKLDLKVLVDVADAMNPKKAGDVIARMEPDAAERLTVALAKREVKDPAQVDPAELPKIEGEKTN